MVQYAGPQCLQSVKRIPIIGPQCSLLGATFAQEHILGTCSWKNGHGIFRKTPKSVYLLILNDFLKSGSPGQTTMLMRRASKFCVKPRSPFSEIYHQGPGPKFWVKTLFWIFGPP